MANLTQEWLDQYMANLPERMKGGDALCPPTPNPSTLGSISSNAAPVKSSAGAHAPRMNKTEMAYGQYLELLRATKEILYWEFEKVAIRIGYRCWFHPDFFIQFPDGHFELHDTKGAKRSAGGKKTYLAEDDAIVKARAIGSGKFPIPIFFVRKGEAGEWVKTLM